MFVMAQIGKTQQAIILYISYIWRSSYSCMVLSAFRSYLYFNIMVFFNLFSHTQVFFFLVGWLFSNGFLISGFLFGFCMFIMKHYLLRNETN